jgi:hypothetical protein
MSELQQVNEQLDAKLILFFDVLTLLYTEQEKLEEQIKDGFWNMSRARYSMGVKFVGIDQIHQDKMSALTKVEVGESDAEDMFTAFTNVGTEGEEAGVDTLGLRKRNLGQSQEKSSPADKDTPIKSKGQHDPIKWFGVLVPPSLRQCQNQFKSSLNTSIAVANLKQKLMCIKSEYLELQKRKLEISSKTDAAVD